MGDDLQYERWTKEIPHIADEEIIGHITSLAMMDMLKDSQLPQQILQQAKIVHKSAIDSGEYTRNVKGYFCLSSKQLESILNRTAILAGMQAVYSVGKQLSNIRETKKKLGMSYLPITQEPNDDDGGAGRQPEVG